MAAETDLPEPALWRELLEQVREQGWEGAQPARLPVKYEQRGGRLTAVGDRLAALRGDLTGDGEDEWVFGLYLPARRDQVARAQADQALPAPSERTRLVVFQRVGDSWRLVWKSAGLGYRFSPNPFVRHEVENELGEFDMLLPPLGLGDVDRDGALEIIYQTGDRDEPETVTTPDGRPRKRDSAAGGMAGIFRYDQGRWVEIAPPADRFSLLDLDGDRKLEVIAGTQFVGQGRGDDDVPRVWRWHSGRYQDASPMYSDFYRRLAMRYSSLVDRMKQAGQLFDAEVWNRAIQKARSLAG